MSEGQVLAGNFHFKAAETVEDAFRIIEAAFGQSQEKAVCFQTHAEIHTAAGFPQPDGKLLDYGFASGRAEALRKLGKVVEVQSGGGANFPVLGIPSGASGAILAKRKSAPFAKPAKDAAPCRFTRETLLTCCVAMSGSAPSRDAFANDKILVSL